MRSTVDLRRGALLDVVQDGRPHRPIVPQLVLEVVFGDELVEGRRARRIPCPRHAAGIVSEGRKVLLEPPGRLAHDGNDRTGILPLNIVRS